MRPVGNMSLGRTEQVASLTLQLDWCAADLPRSRRRDPMTSRLAAQRVAPVYHGQKADVLRIVRDHPLRTAVELAQLWAVERHHGCQGDQGFAVRGELAHGRSGA